MKFPRHFISRGPKTFQVLSLFLPFSALPVLADVNLVVDNFDDGDRADGLDPLDIAWFAGRSNVAVSVADDAVIGGGNALFNDNSTSFSRIIGVLGSPITIEEGETLEFTFDLRYLTEPATGGNLIRFGIYNDGGTPWTGDNTGVQSDDFGYGVFGSAATNAEDGMRVASETAGNSILGGASPGGLAGIGTPGASIAWGTTPHSALFSITRLADGSLDLLSSVDGGTPATANVAPPINDNYTFHEIAIGQGNSNRDLSIDNIRLTLLTDEVIVPTVTSFSHVEGTIWELALKGTPGGSYQLVSSANLDFSSSAAIPLTQGDTENDPGAINGLGDAIATDGNGDATVRIDLGANPVNFVRVEDAP